MKPLIRQYDVRKPYMTTLYAIGDIHGDIEQLEMIHARIKDDIAANRVGNHQIIHIGDLVDRQFHSKRVIDYLITGHESGEPWVTLKGNHDRMMMLFIDHKKQMVALSSLKRVLSVSILPRVAFSKILSIISTTDNKRAPGVKYHQFYNWELPL